MKDFVAGTRAEYDVFIRKKSEELWNLGDALITLSDFVYVTEDSIKGYSDPHGWFIGTWRERSDIKRILMLLTIATRGTNPKLEELYREVQ
jgi:hypothetical protein